MSVILKTFTSFVYYIPENLLYWMGKNMTIDKSIMLRYIFSFTNSSLYFGLWIALSNNDHVDIFAVPISTVSVSHILVELTLAHLQYFPKRSSATLYHPLSRSELG